MVPGLFGKSRHIKIHNKNLIVQAYQRTKFVFAWVEVNDIRIYSCYFAPYNDYEHHIKFLNDINELENRIVCYALSGPRSSSLES